jgi:hypothetical protein
VDPILNPFTPGAGVPPRVWVGRDRELEQAAILLGRLRVGNPERSMVLTGLRGVGKTVLLGRVRRLAEEQGWLTASIEARSDVDLRAELHDVATRLLEVVDPTARLEARLAALRAWLPRLTVASGALSFEVGAGPAALEADVVGLLSRLGAVAQTAQIGVALFIDELQDAPKPALAALCAAMHRAAQDVTPIALVGAGLPTLPGILASAKSYSERLFTYPQIGRLDDQQSRRAIRDTLAELSLPNGDAPTITDEGLEAIVSFAEGYPMFLQSIGKHAWAAATAPGITASDVARAQEPAMQELAADLFTTRWQRATPRQRDYIGSLGRLGGVGGAGEVATGAGFPSSGEASQVREELIAKGIVYPPRRGQIAFTVPTFDRFVVDHLTREGD